VTVAPVGLSRALSARATAAVDAVKVGNWLSRTLGRGSGTVVGGRMGLAVDSTLLASLARGMRVALVTGTNGKTTATRLLVAALAGDLAPLASNDTGANMPAGQVAALVASPRAVGAVLEVDESYLGQLIETTAPRVVILLNLSRDQLDRIAEVRMLVDRWRTALGRLGQSSDRGEDGTVVVANADDPMVVWAAMAAPCVRWVGAGQVWHDDAVGCPACGGRIEFGSGGAWACDRCEFARPDRDAWLDDRQLVLADGVRLSVDLELPGRFNRANAAMVALAAPFMLDGDGPGEGSVPRTSLDTILSRMARVNQVAGRFSSTMWKDREVRLLLAKNPAGWTAIFDLLDEDGAHDGPVVLSINARTADGLDTSWLWDVPFERLVGRSVVATGDRRLDLAVRLRYAEVAHTVVSDPLMALDRAVEIQAGRDSPLVPTDPSASPSGMTRPRPIEFLGNYTAFADLRRQL
jgi:UDP-N-acetylmuramyl tripeptide synthase